MKLKFLLLLLVPNLALAQMKEEQEPANFVTGNLSSDLETTSSTSLIAAQGSGVKVCLKTFAVSNIDTTVDTRVDLLDGSTVKLSVIAANTGGGAVVHLDPPVCGTANTAWNVQAGTTSAMLRAFASGFRSRR